MPVFNLIPQPKANKLPVVLTREEVHLILSNVRVLHHSYATHLLEEGVDIRIISQYLGHKSLESTLIYTHLTPLIKKGVYEKINPQVHFIVAAGGFLEIENVWLTCQAPEVVFGLKHHRLSLASMAVTKKKNSINDWYKATFNEKGITLYKNIDSE